MKQIEYSEARSLMQPGDLIGFSGMSPASFVIRFVTGSDISHVGTILRTNVSGTDLQINHIIESGSIGKGKAGVKINRMSDHIRDYAGKIYWYPLHDDVRNILDEKAMFDFLLSHKGKPYDAPQAILSVLPIESKENFDWLFCSELSAGGYEAGGLTGDKDLNCSKVTPGALVEIPWFKERVLIA